MADAPSTCWELIDGAARGRAGDREAFARRYEPVVRAYLEARWRGTPRLGELDDAVQEVFLECFRGDGLLERAERGRPGGFRAFLHGATRIAALRVERRVARERARAAPPEVDLDGVEADDPTLSRAFDRAWALAIVREARRIMTAAAERSDDAARRRVELLALRFGDGLPVREIARRWNEDPVSVHRAYARARREFREALAAVVAAEHSGPPPEIERECERLLGLLGG